MRVARGMHHWLSSMRNGRGPHSAPAACTRRPSLQGPPNCAACCKQKHSQSSGCLPRGGWRQAFMQD